MIITIFTPGFPPWSIGGEEYYAYYQARELRELGNEVYVIASNIGDVASSKDKSPAFYSMRARLSMARPQMLRYAFTAFSDFFSFLKLRLKPHIIHANDPYGEGLAGVVVAKIFRIPLVITWHAAELVDKSAKFSIIGDTCRRIVLKNANCIIVNSELFKELAVNAVGDKNLESKIYVVSPGVDTDRFKPMNNYSAKSMAFISSNSPVILAVCRLEKIKGLDILIRSAPHVLKVFPKAQFVLVGSGEEKEYLKKLSEELKIHKNIIFTGAVSAELLPSYYAMCDVFTVPTQGEGFGMAFLEAWSSGKPIIVTAHAPEIATLVHKNGGGYVINDDPQELAKAIIKILLNPMLKNSLGKVGRQIALTKYSWKKTIFNIYQIYQTTSRRLN